MVEIEFEIRYSYANLLVFEMALSLILMRRTVGILFEPIKGHNMCSLSCLDEIFK